VSRAMLAAPLRERHVEEKGILNLESPAVENRVPGL
jgi:hypothetical protein